MGQKHVFEIRINGGSCPGKAFRYTNKQLKDLAKKKRVFTIGIEGGDADVAFYQKDDLFNRTKPKEDEQDFRWLVDVETPDLYDVEVKGKLSHYGPKVLVKNGVFFTSDLVKDPITKDKIDFDFFELPSGAEIRELGHVASETKARIVLQPTQVLMFEFRDPDDNTQTCTFTSKDSASIVLKNICFEKDGTTPCESGDFQLHFDSFKPPAGRKKFALTRRGVHPFGQPKTKKSASPAGKSRAGTEDAPCHAMGYGRSGGGTP
jgi:sucrose-6-phosphate hydrolase SacC (GH32 family)